MNNSIRNIFLVLSLALVAMPVLAGGPLINCQSGVPFVWRNAGIDIVFNPDQGGLGPQSNATAVANTAAAFQAWTDIPSATISHVQGPSLSVDVDITNFNPFLNPVAPDGLSAIVYDESGEIFDLLFGVNSGILGFAGPEFVNNVTCEIVEGMSFLNGGAILGGFPEAEFFAVQVHEYGHYQNLAHTVVNGQAAALADSNGPSPTNTFPPENLAGRVETMFPFALVGGGQETPHADDIAILSSLYPEPGFFSSTGSISGTILAQNGVTRLSGVNVIARNVADPFDDAVSAISGDLTDDFSQTDPVAGTFQINGLTAGAQYVVFTDQILQGAFSTTPLALPAAEDCANGASESTDPLVDDPSQCVPIAISAGATVTGVDIAFNAPPPGVLALGDDAFVQLPLPFTFEVCGVPFNSVFVNSNGSLTFGAGDTDFSESAAEFLGGPPRIAGLWDDLSPNSGGTVSFSQSSQEFTILFDNVPEFPAVGGNTFSMTLQGNSGFAVVEYDGLSATDGLAGLTCGGFFTTGLEAQVDIRPPFQQFVFQSVVNQAAKFQVFNPGTSDLDDSQITYQSLGAVFQDNFESNNTLSQARWVSVPFTSEPFWFHTDINPVGGDVDYYRSFFEAGKTLIVEVARGNALDSVVGLFDPAGNLVAVDDDGGTGLLSRLVFPIPTSGIYSFAVSAFSDTDFNGDGASGGRYVLEVSTIDGTLLTLGDDSSVEVDLGFSFPFQGQSYSSVFVNANGNLTFGAGDTDFSESVTEFLDNPPRIAPLWDDLSPNNSGLVVVDGDSGSFTVSFEDVPEFISTGANNFDVTLFADGRIEIAYGSVTALDGLVGVSPGGSPADPGETDLSAAGALSAVGVTYELFSLSDSFDLSGTVLQFNP